ncbi:hypothetical protein [Methanobrevibacter wolinii]|uniref:hypothetical protein n=1 Tax=Methanobrevibacter wolinii TaxID=190977 RepID=UPI0012EC176B|nr:hypothetical protein [Methanobrevibacter wolinii]
MNFLKTDEAKNIIWLDYCGYHIADNQNNLTFIQNIFISKGRMQLYEEMNRVE